MATHKIKTFSRSGALLDTITQAVYDNPHGLVADDASTDAIASLFNNPRFLHEVYSWLSDLPRDAIELSPEELQQGFEETITSFANLFGVEITEYSLDLSAHRPPFIEFLGGEFEGSVALSTWRQHKGGYNGALLKSPTKQELGEWQAEQYSLGNNMADAYISALQVDKLDISNAFSKALFVALDNAT